MLALLKRLFRKSFFFFEIWEKWHCRRPKRSSSLMVRSRHVVQTYSIASCFLQPPCLPCTMAYGNPMPIEYVSTTFLVLHRSTSCPSSNESQFRESHSHWRHLLEIWDTYDTIICKYYFFFNHSIVFICLYVFTRISYYVVFQYRIIIYSTPSVPFFWSCLKSQNF